MTKITVREFRRNLKRYLELLASGESLIVNGVRITGRVHSKERVHNDKRVHKDKRVHSKEVEKKSVAELRKMVADTEEKFSPVVDSTIASRFNWR